MKKYLIALLVIATTFYPALANKNDKPTLTFATDETSGDAYYEEVVQVPNVSQEVLYKRAKDWVVANFKTNDNNINFDEKDFSITNSAAMKVEPKNFFTHAISDGIMDFKFHVWVKEGKYKYRIDNIGYVVIDGTSNEDKTAKRASYNELRENKTSKYLKSIAEEKLYGLSYVFMDAMKNEEKAKSKDNW